jgi:hypothetical protein
MAGQDDLLSRVLAGLDEEALEALSSRGLLRRAGKDVEAGAVGDISREGADTIIAVESETVTLPPEGPAKARCTCPAPGICRHILAAVLVLKSRLAAAPAPVSAADPHAEILALSDEDLRKFAGKPVLRRALELAESFGGRIAFERAGDTLKLRLPGRPEPVIYVAGAGPEGMIAKLPEKHRKLVLAAALLAYRQAHGADLSALAGELRPTGSERSLALDEAERAFLAQIRKLVDDLLGLGLAHLADAARERAFALSVSARGARLPRLANALHSLATAIEALTDRRGWGSESAILARLAELNALCDALESAPEAAMEALRGKPRSRYLPLTSRQTILWPTSGWAWRSPAGYSGVTGLFYAPDIGRWYSRSEVRPDGDAAAPIAGLEMLGPWEGVRFLADAGRRAWRVSGLKSSPDGRLSGGQEVFAMPAGDVDFAAADFGRHGFEDFGAFMLRLAEIRPLGLARPESLDGVFVLRPASWEAPMLDKVAQLVWRRIGDAAGREVILEVPLAGASANRATGFRALDPAKDGLSSVLVRAVFSGSRVRLEPLACFGGKFLSYQLDAFEGTAPACTEAPMPGSRPSPLASRLDLLNTILLNLAESGLSRLGPMEQAELGTQAARLARLGLRDLPPPSPRSPHHRPQAPPTCCAHPGWSGWRKTLRRGDLRTWGFAGIFFTCLI